MIHVFFYRNIWLIHTTVFEDGFNVKVDGPCNFREVVGWNAGGHAHSDAVAPVEQQVWQAGRKHGRFVFGIVKIRLEINGVFVDVIEHVLRDSVQAALRVSHGGWWVAID